MASIAKDNVSYRLLNKLSNLVICSSCLRNGTVTPVPQVISGRHSLTNECAECRAKSAGRNGQRKRLAKPLSLCDWPRHSPTQCSTGGASTSGYRQTLFLLPG